MRKEENRTNKESKSWGDSPPKGETLQDYPMVGPSLRLLNVFHPLFLGEDRPIVHDTLGIECLFQLCKHVVC